MPQGRGDNQVVVLHAGTQQDNFTGVSYSPPVVASVTPDSAATNGGVNVVVSGSSFDTNGTVTIGGVLCSPVTGRRRSVDLSHSLMVTSAYSHTSITCKLPAGQGVNLAVQVTSVYGKTGSANLFSYTPPVISGLQILSVPTAGFVNLTVSGSRCRGHAHHILFPHLSGI